MPETATEAADRQPVPPLAATMGAVADPLLVGPDDHPDGGREALADRVRSVASGLAPLLARAEAVQRERATAAKRRGAPRWTDVFTTQFTEFSNRPR